MSRLVHRLVVLYPRDWRDRYGDELIELTDELIAAGKATPMRAGLDLIAGSARERGRSAVRPHGLSVAAVVALLIAGTMLTVNHRGDVTGPYFETHSIGYLLLAVVVCWLFMEFIMMMRAQERRDEGGEVVRTRQRSLLLIGGLLAMNLWLYIAPTIVPAANIRAGAVAFTIGVVILVVGIGLRLWSFIALDRSFSISIQVRPDQPVVTSGPYRLIRHPCYAGSLLAVIGIGLMSANWVGLAAMTLLPLLLIVWRIQVEESALVATLGDRYRSYAVDHKRLVPHVW